MRQEPNAFLEIRNAPKPGRPLRPHALLWPKVGTLLVPACLWLNTQRIAALVVKRPVLSNVWWPLRPKNGTEIHEKALALWMNSTLGFISMLLKRGDTRGAWIKLKKPNLSTMRILDMKSLNAEQIGILEESFDSLAGETLMPFPQMASDPVRAKIDAAISKALNLPDLFTVRESLGREPMITLCPIGSIKNEPVKSRKR